MTKPKPLAQNQNWACLLKVGDELCWVGSVMVLDNLAASQDEIIVSGLMEGCRVTIALAPDDMVTYRRPEKS